MQHMHHVLQAVSAKVDELAQLAPIKTEPLSSETTQGGEDKQLDAHSCKAMDAVALSTSVSAAAGHDPMATCSLTAIKAEDDKGKVPEKAELL